MTLWQALLLAAVEGLTEFLPVSSTGHMIIVSTWMGIQGNDFVKLFTVGIQFGAILSVVVLYRSRFFRSVKFYLKLLTAFLPSAVAGYLLGDYIDALLENVVVVGVMLLAGGIVFLFIDNWFDQNHNDKEISYAQAFKIGLFQVIAMVPGVSRSAATIIGGLQQGLGRRQAAEFSFLLAVPTMLAATIYKLHEYHQKVGFSMESMELFLIGNFGAFVVATLAIKGLIAYLQQHGFRLFGYYRITVGLIILLMWLLGMNITMP